jgi:SAM-dependent methyltransferase
LIHDGFSSAAYWEARYRSGGTSGAGSYGRLATFKAAFINAFVADNGIEDVLDMGCGDGNLLSLLQVPRYIGIDVSATSLLLCAHRFGASERHIFMPAARLDELAPTGLAMSIDVLFHLTEDEIFKRHIDDLFGHATRFVLIYASNFDSDWPSPHVRHRRFSNLVAERWPSWRLLAHLPNRFPYDPKRPDDTSFADFFVYCRTMEPCVIRLPEA